MWLRHHRGVQKPTLPEKLEEGIWVMEAPSVAATHPPDGHPCGGKDDAP